MTKSEKKKLRDAFFRELGPNVSTFKEMFDAAPQLAIYFKDAKGRIMAINRRNCDICNIKNEWDAVGKRSCDIFPSSYAADYMKNDADVLASGKPLIGYVSEYPADRSNTCLVSNVYPLRNSRGKVIGTARAYRLATSSEMNALRYGKIRAVTAYVERHYAENLSLDALIALSGLSKNGFIRAFHEVFDMTPWHYLTTIRLNAARRLLETTDKLLADIATETGFFDQSHLSRVFKQERGMTPGEYRRLHKVVS